MSKAKKVYKQNDHIILPKATLKRFADSKTNKIKYLDLSNPENLLIKEAFPKTFHTKTNFYNPEYDNIVKRYETMIGKYNKSISDIGMRNENFKLDEKQMKKDIIDIITIQFDRIALALYPVKNERIIKYLTKEEVDWLIPRAIESALAINSDFRQIVGEENYLNCIKNKLEKYKSILCNLNDDTILVKGNEVILNDDLECFELLVSIMLFKPNYHKFVMELSAISNEFLHKSEFLHSIEIFKERECYIVFVNNLGLDTSVIQITVAQNNEEAITMF